MSVKLASIFQVGSPGKKEKPARSVLQGIVDHFMTLFDVQKISGVYARMSDLYTKLGEVNNILRTLRSLLCLRKSYVLTMPDTVRLGNREKSRFSEKLQIIWKNPGKLTNQSFTNVWVPEAKFDE